MFLKELFEAAKEQNLYHGPSSDSADNISYNEHKPLLNHFNTQTIKPEINEGYAHIITPLSEIVNEILSGVHSMVRKDAPVKVSGLLSNEFIDTMYDKYGKRFGEFCEFVNKIDDTIRLVVSCDNSTDNEPDKVWAEYYQRDNDNRDFEDFAAWCFSFIENKIRSSRTFKRFIKQGAHIYMRCWDSDYHTSLEKSIVF